MSENISSKKQAENTYIYDGRRRVRCAMLWRLRNEAWPGVMVNNLTWIANFL